MKFQELLPVLEDVQPIAIGRLVGTSNPGATVAATINDPTKAPSRFPYPLDTIMDDLAESYLQLHNAREKLDLAARNNLALPVEQRARLKLLRDKIALSAKTARDVAAELELRFTLDN